MRKLTSIIGAALLGALVIVAAASLTVATTAKADSQGQPYATGLVSGLPASVVVAATSNQTSVITLWPNRGCGLHWAFSGSATNVGKQSIYVFPSVDGTNAASGVNPTILTGTANGTNVITVDTVFSRTTLDGYQALLPTVVSNGASGGTQTLTNLGLMWVIPIQ